MTSSDREILLQINCRLDRIEFNQHKAAISLDNIDRRLSAVEQNYLVMHEDIRVHDARLEMGIWFTGICFGVLALVIAFVGIFAPKFWEHINRKVQNTVSDNQAPASVPAPAQTVINIPQPQIDINSLAEQVSKVLKSL